MRAAIPIRRVVQPLFKTSFLMERMVGRILQEKHGLGIAQLRALIALKNNPGISQRRIAEYWGIAEASASRQLKILAHRGFIREDKNPANRREHQLSLSTAGAKELKAALRLADRELERQFKTMTDRHRRALIESLDVMLNSIQNS